MTRWLMLVACIGGLAASARLGAQTPDSAAKQAAPSDPRDTLFLRARTMVLNGNAAAGRAVVDSALAAASGTPEYGVALYWRAALAATAADAERDYRRVIVEYPFSSHSGDALLAIAQLEMARSDRASAIDHLQRYLIQQPPDDPHRVRAGIWLGRLLLETNQLPKGCAVLMRTRAALGDTAVEIRNQVDYYASRCAGVDTVRDAGHVASGAGASAPTRDAGRVVRAAAAEAREDSAPPSRATPPASGTTPAATPSAPRTTQPASRPAPTDRYTVQVAAYDTKTSAQRLVTKLGERGIVARVVGTAAPFRVRIGHYATDAAATEAVRQLKSKGMDGFVTTTDNESQAARKP